MPLLHVYWDDGELLGSGEPGGDSVRGLGPWPEPEQLLVPARGGEAPDVRVGLPSFPTLMRWLFLGRTVLAVTTLIQAALAFSAPPAEGADFARYVAFMAVITVVFALYKIITL